MSDEHIYKSHNKRLLLYHLVFPAKYRRKIFTEEVGERLKEIWSECRFVRRVSYPGALRRKGMKADCNHLIRTTPPMLCVRSVDLEGYRPERGKTDVNGEIIEDRLYICRNRYREY